LNGRICRFQRQRRQQHLPGTSETSDMLLEATAGEAAFFSQTANHPLTAHLAQ
jgi:hypothetical protein